MILAITSALCQILPSNNEKNDHGTAYATGSQLVLRIKTRTESCFMLNALYLHVLRYTVLRWQNDFHLSCIMSYAHSC